MPTLPSVCPCSIYLPLCCFSLSSIHAWLFGVRFVFLVFFVCLLCFHSTARWMCFFWVSCFIFVVSSRRRQKNQIFVQRCAHETQANRSPYLSLAISEHGHFYFLINVFSNLFRENNNHRNETTKHVAFLRCSDFFVGSHRIVRLVGCDVSLTTAATKTWPETELRMIQNL